MNSARDRLALRAREWRVNVDKSFETETSLIAFGTRDEQPVVLKVIKQLGDEWNSGEVLAAFASRSFARVYQHAPGAVLLERIQPAHSLIQLSLNGRDEEAIEIMANVLHRTPVIDQNEIENCASLADWGRGFERYLTSDDKTIPKPLVEAAQEVFAQLSASQKNIRLLHGDFQHYNVLFDSERGWLAIDPKGVFGELEYEIGAVLRNPVEAPELFLSTAVIKNRLKQFTTLLHLDHERILQWAFAQSVLSAIWEIEDGHTLAPNSPILRLAALLEDLSSIDRKR